jgi:ribosomal protein S18 acetylase RimI-like enzyme
MTEPEPQRVTRANTDGVPVLTYLEGVRDGRPWADLVEAVGPDPVPLILDQLAGWAVSAPVQLGRELVARGATVIRHAHAMSRDLAGDPPPTSWAALEPSAGVRVVPCDRTAAEIFPAWRAAYPADHPDWNRRGDAQALTDDLEPLLAGRQIGPLLPCSRLAVDGDDRVVAGAIITDWDGNPWAGDVFRQPGDRYAGLGSLVLRRALAAAAAAGLPRVGLAVSDGNPARRLYERLGFTVTETALTVAVPPT